MNRPSLGDHMEGRLNNFDVMRFVLAILVIVSHSYPLLRGDNQTELLSVATGGQLNFGEVAVNGFFILSGFLITQSWQRSRGLGDYLRKRVLRIYPGFIVVCLISGLLIAPMVATSSAAYWQKFSMVQFTLYQVANLKLVLPRGITYFADNPIHGVNGSLWSIKLEFLCYLGVAFLGLIGVLRRPRVVLMLGLAICLLYALDIWLGIAPSGANRLAFHLGSPRAWLRVGSCFAIGSVFYVYRDQIPFSGRWFLAAVAIMVATALWPQPRLLTVLFPILGSYVLLYLALQRSPLNHFGRHGDFSYGLYLYAFPIQQLLVQSLGLSTHPLFLAALAFPLTLVAAFLSWHLVEKTFLRLKETRWMKPRVPAPAPVIVSESSAVG